MPADLTHIDDHTPMGANLVANGATFRLWAPRAKSVHVLGSFNSRVKDDSSLLTRKDGHWRGFLPNVKDGDTYEFHVVGGPGREGPKRDPYARELTNDAHWDCIIRSVDFPWHETGFVTPEFHNLVIYQLHVGAFYTPRWPTQAGTFLDVVAKIPYLKDLGVTALQLLPVVEFPGSFSLGYNGVDYFSPEMAFGIEDADLAPFETQCNALLAAKGLAPYPPGTLRGEMRQLKALVDICHVYGLAVIFDVVFNHAGGGFGDESIYYLDRQASDSLYFSTRGWAGGLVFDFSNPGVRQFLIDNARFWLREFRVDGFRYDEVSVIDREGWPHGWSFCQDLTGTLRAEWPRALQHAEYWDVNPWIVKETHEGGAGFHTTLTDHLRKAVRRVVRSASYPGEHELDMDAVARALEPAGFDARWRCVQGLENHDIVLRPKDENDHGREERLARLSDPGNPRSWFGKSRTRVATGLSLTAPGIPMLFMGQEFLEDKQWTDALEHHPELLLHWPGLDAGDKAMLDHIRFIRELIRLRFDLPALRGEGFRATHVHNANRVLAFHRWVPGEGHDVLVVAHFGNYHRYGYEIGFPAEGEWIERFNSDVYENWVNPVTAGNGGRVWAFGPPQHGFPYSAPLVLPANSILVFARP